mmetsp:Transcript_1506/g.3621  ORF Transcript_1506/g.3621 Transcript_1506/m.3621 type:complete len:175 (-) Transcript_1506:65-589(-)|eukprot:CAMPEP_0206241318 /NCGR_PEP_ID=MMETSP0047_2-20121206/16428_1 /ASSEMBLY_ACC=CAM_ASM_000192 /TAXON_ID=195065 /ORGANISM="Chroomonas mesostigmatica_cf, Strain CCMP1168" /LENGTH=174 /DNA_ID=CAMNT_0053666199 /DNA_START=180 /DNA_END=704 /DNA_ORIENTATION=+
MRAISLALLLAASWVSAALCFSPAPALAGLSRLGLRAASLGAGRRPRLTRGCRMSGNELVSIEPEPRMSGAIVHKGIVYTCGMICEEGGENKDVKQQTKDALDELDRVLALAKSDKHHILTMQAWVGDMSYLADMNEVYDAWVSKTMPPGRACVESKLVPPCLVEFKAVAAVIE